MERSCTTRVSKSSNFSPLFTASCGGSCCQKYCFVSILTVSFLEENKIVSESRTSIRLRLFTISLWHQKGLFKDFNVAKLCRIIQTKVGKYNLFCWSWAIKNGFMTVFKCLYSYSAIPHGPYEAAPCSHLNWKKMAKQCCNPCSSNMKQQPAAKTTIKTANTLRKPSNRIKGCSQGEKKKNTAVFKPMGQS